MAFLTDSGNVYTLSGAAGVGLHNREDLSDLITNISPTECPFYTGIGGVKAAAVTHEWLTHELAAAAADNVVVESNEATLTTPTTLTRITNTCQINQKSVAVSGTQDAVNKAGMAKELAYRVILHTKEIKRDIESAMLQNTQAVTGSTTIARRMNGANGFITTNTGTTTVALTVDDVNGLLEDVWTAGGAPDVLIGNGNTKSLLSALAHSNTGTNVSWDHDADAKRLVTAVGVWDGDFGVQRIIPDRFDTTLTIKALQMDMWKRADLRPLRVKKLGDTGDSTKRMLTAELTLECRAENANGNFTHAGT